MNKSKTTEVEIEAEPPVETWGRNWFWVPSLWLPVLWLPILWFSVWCVVAGLVAWERRLAGIDSPVAQLGWLPVFVATLLMSLYLQWQRREASQSLRRWLRKVRPVQYLVWIVIVWYLGGWETSLLGLLVLLAGELQSWVLLQAGKPVPVSPFAGSLENVGKKDETGLESSESHLFEETSPEVLADSATGQPHTQEETEDETEDEIEGEINEEQEELENGQFDLIGESELGTWRQKMSRRVIESVPESMTQADERGSREQIEWFGRHVWQAGHVQVDLHVPFQPAFAVRPEIEVAVVEGEGEATVGDVLPYGTRVQIKRAKLQENAAGITVVWLQATGPVEP